MIKLKNIFQPTPQQPLASAALLLLRLIVGSAFIIHGAGKIQHPFHWMGPEATVPSFFQFLAAISEFGGGIAWIFGLLTPLASFGIACTMTVAVHMHLMIRHDSFVNPTGGLSYEPALVYLGIAILMMTVGPGKFSLDAKLFGERQDNQ